MLIVYHTMLFWRTFPALLSCHVNSLYRRLDEGFEKKRRYFDISFSDCFSCRFQTSDFVQHYNAESLQRIQLLM